LAGNPNTGKSTVFNALTGLRQHTGNWPGKTVVRAEGGFDLDGRRAKLIDLPGTYSLQAGSADEEVARDFVLFGQPDVTVVVVDATRLERNLNLVLQVLEITDRVVVCVNLMDEAKRHGLEVDADRLEAELGVPVVATVARRERGIAELLTAIDEVARGTRRTRPFRIERHAPEVESVVGDLASTVESAFPGLPNARWVALRLLNADDRVEAAVRADALGRLRNGTWPNPETASREPSTRARRVLARATELRWKLSPAFHDQVTARLYREARRVALACVTQHASARRDWDSLLDRILTSRVLGLPAMLLVLAVVFWITISGANVPSTVLAGLLIDDLHPILGRFLLTLGAPEWLRGILVDGVYLSTAWVVSVMLPPMAIFFPLFTLLEDFGYLPRVAFNLDRLFQAAGAHGKQALTMCMGFGCNAAGVVSTRVIDSPRERLVAILTNNFSLCNGRWPTQILLASIFIGVLAPAHLAGFVSAAAVVTVAVLGIGAMFVASWLLTRTVLRGEATTFSLELPPYRRPRVLQTLYTSLIDRTLIVLWRAIVFAAPAGAVIWLVANVDVGGQSVAELVVGWLDPIGLLLGLNGVILLAYVIAIPANEIVIPTVLMLTALTIGGTAGTLFEPESAAATGDWLRAGGWTLLTGVNVMLFSLLHNPCSTTLYTIYRETNSARWTAVAAVLPLLMGATVCFLVAQLWRLAST
jgi:ferrous iron transport protein B